MGPDAKPAAAPLAGALALYLAWTAGTWWFEGRIGLLTREDGGIGRIVYALGVNLLLGIVGGIVLLRIRRRPDTPHATTGVGFPGAARSLVASAAGLALGLAFYWLQGAPSRDPTVVGNGFAQVFVVSAAEVIVCWAVVGTACRDALRPRFGRAATPMAASIAAALFGLYHFAHSAPFDTWSMVGFLTVVGLFTGAFFFVSGDAIATLVFHNFLGTFGVVQALVAAHAVDRMATPQWHLLGTAAVTLAVLIAGHVWLRRNGPPRSASVPPAHGAIR